jgi:hypothetical protein
MDRDASTIGTRASNKRVRFTPAVLEAKAPRSGRIERRDDISPLWLRITASGDRSFAVRVRIKGRQQPLRLTYPERAHISNLAAAREWAIKTDGQCRAGRDPREEARALELAKVAEQRLQEDSLFEKVAASFLATNGATKKNARPWRDRTAKAYERTVRIKFLPRWKGRTIHSITRDEVSDFLARIADTAPVEANRNLAVLSALMSWYQTQRGSNYTSPIVRGMAPTEETPRNRSLSDDEIRLVWHVASRSGVYGGIVRTMLLNGTRRGEPCAMRHSQIGPDGIWALPGEFTKNHMPLYLPLSAETLAVIAAQPRVEGQDFVFSVNGETAFDNWSKSKERFDRRILSRLRAQARAAGQDAALVKPMPGWTLHDLRRTAKSLMSRAKVRPEHSERVLNHMIRGVEGTYDRYSYVDEKRDALDRLARLVREIVDGLPSKVVNFSSRIAAH